MAPRLAPTLELGVPLVNSPEEALAALAGDSPGKRRAFWHFSLEFSAKPTGSAAQWPNRCRPRTPGPGPGSWVCRALLHGKWRELALYKYKLAIINKCLYSNPREHYFSIFLPSRAKRLVIVLRLLAITRLFYSSRLLTRSRFPFCEI
jgi:hypothetical protein